MECELETFIDIFAIAMILEAEQRLQCDRAREAAEFALEIDRFAIAPLCNHGFGEFCHHRRIGLHLGFEECRLKKPPLPEPEIAFARDETIAEYRLERSRTEMLGVVLGVRDEHLLNEVGIACEEQPPAADAKAGERAVGARKLQEKVNSLWSDLADVAAEKPALRTRRQGGARYGERNGHRRMEPGSEAKGNFATTKAEAANDQTRGDQSQTPFVSG